MTPAPPAHPQIIRKRLEDDCLLHGELHPSIAERLARIRELPVMAAANLLNVERDEQGVWLVWQRIEGETLEQYLVNPAHQQADLERILRQLRLAVAAMHAHGIVHGAIHSRNVIIDARGRVCLTHISPLLYDDPAVDEQALAELARRLAPDVEAQSIDMIRRDASADRKIRLGAYLAAGAALLLGIAMFLGILWYIRA